MAEGTSLVLVFNDGTGGTTQISWKYAKPSATKANVLAFANELITQTSLLSKTLVSLKSAKTVTTSENVFDLEDTRDIPEELRAIIAPPEPEENDANDEERTVTIADREALLERELAAIRAQRQA